MQPISVAHHGTPNLSPPGTFKTLDWTQAGAVQNTWYSAGTFTNVHFYLLGVGITVADETVEMRITVDGTVYQMVTAVNLAFAGNAVSEVGAIGSVGTTAGYFRMGAADTSMYGAATLTCVHWLKGKSITIEVRKTTAGGASALRVIGYYGDW